MPLKMKIKSGCEKFAVGHDSNCGPTFGAGPSDLYVSDSSNSTDSLTNSSHSYDGPNGKVDAEGGKFIHDGPTIKFKTIEVEVFQVV